MIFGTYHSVSRAYLERYIDEAVYRFNTKDMKGGDRFSYMFSRAICRVQYRDVRMAA